MQVAKMNGCIFPFERDANIIFSIQRIFTLSILSHSWFSVVLTLERKYSLDSNKTLSHMRRQIATEFAFPRPEKFKHI